MGNTKVVQRLDLGIAYDLDQRIIQQRGGGKGRLLPGHMTVAWIRLCARGLKNKPGHDPGLGAGAAACGPQCSQTETQQFSARFEGTFSLQKARVVVILMAPFIVSSFGDVHKRCMKVLPLWSFVFSLRGSEDICTGAAASPAHMSFLPLKASPGDEISGAQSWRAATGIIGHLNR